VPFDGAGYALGIAGRQQVEERTAQDGEQQRPFLRRRRGVRLPLLAREQVKPVAHGVPAEDCPRPGVTEAARQASGQPDESARLAGSA
jgi:hypothetical protein